MSSFANAPGGLQPSHGIAGSGYVITISVVIVLLVAILTVLSYYCTKNSTAAAVLPQTDPPPPPAAGLDDVALTRFPELLYSEAKMNRGGDSTAATCCSICLADYKSSDVIRVLPDCGHFFHLKCVDPWLRLHPNCPVCRTSSPLAEVVPPATRPIGDVMNA